MQMMFEDNPEATISKFLCKVYSNADSCKELYFLRGNTGLERKIDKVYLPGYRYIVYIDVAPDNYKTINAYMRLNMYYQNVKDIYVIPIPCIEYYIIKAYGNRDVNEISQIFAGRHVKETDLVMKIQRGVYKSFEDYCKKVLDHCMLPCQKKDGRFYTQDCLCNKPLRGKGCTLASLESKAAGVIRKLPVFIMTDSIKGNIGKLDFYKDVPRVKRECINLYYDIANDFKSNGYISSIIHID